MRVLVTGGAGFIGSLIVDQLLASGHQVFVVDDLDPAAHDGPPEGLSPATEYRWGDAGDVGPAALDGVDAVCHQAAKVGLGVDFADVDAYATRNVTATARLLRALHERDFRGPIVLASSMVVYGEGRYRCPVHGLVRPGPRDAADLEHGRFEARCPQCGGPLVPEPVPEDHWLDPRNVYATTKLAQEGLVQAYAREHPGSVASAERATRLLGFAAQIGFDAGMTEFTTGPLRRSLGQPADLP